MKVLVNKPSKLQNFVDYEMLVINDYKTDQCTSMWSHTLLQKYQI